MADCDVEASSLPVLSGCPTDNEYFLVGNAAGGQGLGQYGRRLWSDVRKCALAGLNYEFKQFTVGKSGSPIAAGQTTIIVSQAGIIPQSVFITSAGPELPQDDDTQVSYDVTISPSNMVIIFNQAVANGQQFIMHYSYVS